MPLLEAQGITYWYPESREPALKNIHLRLEEGEFLLVTGRSGSGKSSLARVLAGLIPGFYGGRFGGRVLLDGRDITGLGRRELGTWVGIVFQDPEKQLVMPTVEAEIAFGLENLGLPLQEMQRRVAETMGFLGLTFLKDRFTADLSGGEKQKVALASVLAMQPRVLILDEPTSQLDPAAAEEILQLVARLHREMGFTVVLIEQRVERCFHLADRLVVMEKGDILYAGPVREAARRAAASRLPFVPPVTRFFAAAGFPAVPVTVGEGRALLKSFLERQPLRPSRRPAPAARPSGGNVVETDNVWFTYPDGREALRGLSCAVREGEYVAVMGANAAGKSTLLKVMAGLLPPGRGRVRLLGRDTRRASPGELAGQVGYLTQNPDDFLLHATVEEEVRFDPRTQGHDARWVDSVLRRLDLLDHRRANPRDLSTGERQRVALASVLAAKPRLLLLDEPTRGLDCVWKEELGRLLREMAIEGMAVVVVTHDTEFVAQYAERVILLFDGQLVADGPKHAVLGRSVFYAPQICRLFHGFTEEIVLTLEEACALVRSGGEMPGRAPA